MHHSCIDDSRGVFHEQLNDDNGTTIVFYFDEQILSKPRIVARQASQTPLTACRLVADLSFLLISRCPNLCL